MRIADTQWQSNSSLISCGLLKKTVIVDMRIYSCGATFLKKLRKPFLQIGELRLQT
jgi:hypothetical protein